MANKKVIILSSICTILLLVSLTRAVLLNQKRDELELKKDQLSQIESEKNILETQVSTLESDVNLSNTKIVTLESQITNLQSEKDSYEDDISNLESQISSIQTEKTSLINQKSTLESQLGDLQSEKNSLEMEKINLQSQITDLQSEITTLDTEKTSLEAQIPNLQTQISTLENDVIESYNTGYSEGEAEGYFQGVIDGAGSGYNIRDPTYTEVIMFVASDRTNENEYIIGEYVCWNFAADFEANAFQQGYKVGFVYIEFVDGAHAIACFNTTDNGLIFIEPQDDHIMTSLTIDENYWDRNLYIVNYDDTIVTYEVIW